MTDAPVTRSRIRDDLRTLGLRTGDTLMLHASVKAIGHVVGGPDTVIATLLDVLGPEGTLVMMVGWEDSPYEMPQWPPEWQQAYRDELSAFDPARSRAYRKWSILTEYLRTWPGACRSNHPDVSFAAIGARAAWITADHPLSHPYGPGSPLDKLVQANGRVLLLGVDFESLTLLHFAENLARVSPKPLYHYQAPILVDGEPTWVDIEEIDSNLPIGGWQGESYFTLIGDAYLATGRAARGTIGAAPSILLSAADFVPFALDWLESHLGGNSA